MKIIKILVVLALVVGAVVFFTKPKNKAAVEKVTDDIATDARATSKVATNVAADIKAGAKKVEEVVTNAVDKAADFTTNVVDQAKQALEGKPH